MPVLSLPLTFNNSFWSQDYRRGLEVVHAKLTQGVEEDAEVIEFIRARARVERDLAQSLTAPHSTGSRGHGMDRDDGASLLVAFRGLQQESIKQGEAHLAVANELDTLVADPFESWADQHAGRIAESKSLLIDGFLKSYEDGVADVKKLQQAYTLKARKADEAEDDAKFAPNSQLSENLTSAPSSPRMTPRRSESISDRISHQLFGHKSSSSTSSPQSYHEPLKSPPIVVHGPDDLAPSDNETTPTKKLDKGKGKEIPPPLPALDITEAAMSPSFHSQSQPEAFQIILAGAPFPAPAIPELMTRARAELPLRPIRIPFLGEYEDTFTGEDFVTWLKDKVPAFEGSLDRAEAAARELTERDNLLRRVGEFGNKFENHPAATYQFRPKAFEVPEPVSAPSSAEDKDKDAKVLSPVLAQSTSALIKRSNTVASYLAKSLKSSTLSSGSAPEPPYRKARLAAEEANEKYRVAVRKLDRQRLLLEDRVEIALKQWGRWELDRLRAVKTVLLQYQGTLAGVAKATAPSLERSSTLLASFQPESDLLVAIERYRTGPFRPKAHVYESVTHARASDVVFGIDLRGWAGEGGWHAVRAGNNAAAPEHADTIPWVVKGLLGALAEAYKGLGGVESRKAWIYDVPLPAQHQLREALNVIPINEPIPSELLSKQDAPVLASVLKLWLLELDPSLGTWEGWEEIRRIYPSIGADKTKEGSIVDELKLALGRLPKVHLLVLDAIIKHLKDLVDSTNAPEDNEVYVTKLALSVGRCILRPQHETSLSIQDRHPTVFFIDLINNYDAILPPTIAHKKRDSGRAMPIRKRTAPVDMRMHRSRLSQNIDPQELLAAQKEMQTGVSHMRAVSPSPGDRTPRRLSFVAPPPPPALGLARVSSNDAVAAAATPAVSGPPPRPTFIEPPPENDDEQSSGSVVVIPPSPIDAAPAVPPPPPTTLADTPATGEPIKEAIAEVQSPHEIEAPPAPPPAPVKASSPTPPRTTSPTSPPPSGRNTPPGGGSIVRNAVAAANKRASSPPSRTPSVSSSLRRESSLGSNTGTSSTPTGARPGGPRIVRGPRVAHRGSQSISAAAAAAATSGSTPAPGASVAALRQNSTGTSNPGLKRRPLSGIGFTSRTMASESEGGEE